MTTEEIALKASLSRVIEDWINDNCDSDDWTQLDVYIHPEMSGDMANAAFQVLLSSAKSQQYAKSQGYFD